MKEVWGQSFDIKTTLFPWATGSVSSSNLSNSMIWRAFLACDAIVSSGY